MRPERSSREKRPVSRKKSDTGVKYQVGRHSRRQRKRRHKTDYSLHLKHKGVRLSQNSANVGGKKPTEIGSQLKLRNTRSRRWRISGMKISSDVRKL